MLTDLFGETITYISNQWVLGIVIISAIFIYYTRKSIGRFIEKVNIPAIIHSLKRNEKFKYKISDLEQHDLFLELENSKGSRFDFYTHGKLDTSKSEFFIDFLNILLENTKISMLKVCYNATNELSRVSLKHLIVTSLQECNYSLNKDLLERFINEGLTKDQAKQVINKFHGIRSSTIDRYNKRVESIFACDFYENNFQLLLAVYEVIAFELDDVIGHSTETFDRINGLFMELAYKN